jgi:hypothetical protein
MNTHPFCLNEIDKIDYTRCPFEPTHSIHKETQYLPHITKCKERARVASSLVRCRHYNTHMFTSQARLDYHEPRCEFHIDRKRAASEFGSVAVKREIIKCRFNPQHHILDDIDAIRQHEDTCPNKGNPVEDPELRLRRIREQATDMTPTGVLNRNHGFAPADRNVYLAPTKHAKLSEESYELRHTLAQQKITIHLSSFAFSAVKLELKPVLETHIYIDNFTFADKDHYPGFRELEESRTHQSYLAAYLWEDSSDPTSVQIYKRLVVTLTSQVPGHPQSSIAVCNQCAGSENIVWLIVHKSETSGFGGRIDKSELGLFCIPSTFLYGRMDTRQQLQSTLTQVEFELAAVQKLYSELLLRSSDETSQLMRLRTEINLKENEFFARLSAKETEFNDKIEKYKKNTSQVLQAYKQTAQQDTDNNEAKLRQALAELERSRQEKATILHNAQSEMTEKQRLTERVSELEALCKAKDKSITKLNQTIKQKTKEYSTSISRMTDSHIKFSVDLEAAKRSAELARAQSAETVRTTAAQERHLDDRELCMFCMEKAKNTMYVPCGHLMYCSDCLEQHLNLKINARIPENDPNKQCHICKEAIQRVNFCYAY